MLLATRYLSPNNVTGIDFCGIGYEVSISSTIPLTKATINIVIHGAVLMMDSLAMVI